MNERWECKTCAGVAIDDEIYLFGDQANQELDRLRSEHIEIVARYTDLLDRYVDLQVKYDRVNAALNRAIEVMAHMEKKYGVFAQEIQTAADPLAV